MIYEKTTIMTDCRDELVSDLAHEFRAPLTAISGNAELMLDPSMSFSERQHFLQIILSEAKRLNGLVDDLIALQSIQECPPAATKQVNIRAIAEETRDIMEATLQKKHIELAINGEAPDIRIEPNRLKQVLINLIDNAYKHLPEGGKIEISLSSADGSSSIRIEDNGIGFGDVDLSQLFERFYRTDSSRSHGITGSGLGLSIVHAIVHTNGGTITAFNAPKGDAVFLITFPASDQ